MRLNVLGRYSPFPPPGGACPGYLVEADGAFLLLECGSGVVSRLQKFIPLHRLRHVILSHLHGDHCSDLAILRYAADADVRHREDPPPVEVLAPGEPEDEFARIEYKEAVRARPVRKGDRVKLGPFAVQFTVTKHPMPCHAMRLETVDRTLVYTGDAAYTSELVDFARGADLLLAESSLPEEKAGFRGHMTASEAGRMAERAEVDRLLLTHFWPWADVSAMVENARKCCPSIPVAAVEEETTYRI